ncbi:hypothetical protein [Enemella sp. A6]|uniref:hypothetical protein n=1 Tax=Enemella sp. A6 TaxID=3440152 RepID=UPI003EBD6665
MDQDQVVDTSPKGPERLRKVTLVALVLFALEPLVAFVFPVTARALPPVLAHGAVLLVLVVASLAWGRANIWRKRVVTAAVITGLIAGFWAWQFVAVTQKRPTDVCHAAAGLHLDPDDDFDWPNDWDAKPYVVFSWPGNYTCQFSGDYAATSFTLPIPTLISSLVSMTL